MVDRYTKIVLTVIAAALVALVAQNAIGPARALGVAASVKVAICDATGAICAPVDFDGVRVKAASTY